jgi:hypothetical protein
VAEPGFPVNGKFNISGLLEFYSRKPARMSTIPDIDRQNKKFKKVVCGIPLTPPCSSCHGEKQTKIPGIAVDNYNTIYGMAMYMYSYLTSH